MPIKRGGPDVEISEGVHPMRCRRGARSSCRRRIWNRSRCTRRPVRRRHWPMCAPRAPLTCRNCAPECRQAEDESSPASNSTRRKSRTAASRPSPKPCRDPGVTLVRALSLRRRQPRQDPIRWRHLPRQSPMRPRRPALFLKHHRHRPPHTERSPAVPGRALTWC